MPPFKHGAESQGNGIPVVIGIVVLITGPDVAVTDVENKPEVGAGVAVNVVFSRTVVKCNVEVCPLEVVGLVIVVKSVDSVLPSVDCNVVPVGVDTGVLPCSVVI